MQNYRECEYINISGYNTFFDTGFLLKPSFKFVLSFMDLKGPSNTSWGCFVGNREGNTNQGFVFRVGGPSRVFAMGTKTSLAQIPFKSGIVNVEGGNTYLLDLDSGDRADSDYDDFTSTKNVLIGNNINQSSNPINVNYYSFKLYDGEILIGDYVPCLDSSNRVAFYNNVTDSFIYPNQTSGITYKLKPIARKFDIIKEIGKPLKVTIVKGSNWNNTKAIDFGGADVDFSGQDDTHNPFYNNTALTSVTNGVIITDNCHNLLSGCTNLKTFDCVFTGDNIRSAFIHCDNLANLSISAPNATNISYAFQHCKSLTSFDNTFPKADNCRGLMEHCTGLTKASIDVPMATNTQLILNDCKGLTECYINMPNVSSLSGELSGCTSLANVEMIVGSTHSGWVQSDFAIPSAAPCNAYKYVDLIEEPYIQVGNSTTNSPSNVITFQDILFGENESYKKVRIKFRNTIVGDKTMIGFVGTISGSSAGGALSFGQGASSSAYFRCGSTSITQISSCGVNQIKEYEFGNKYIKDLTNGSYVYQSTKSTTAPTDKFFCLGFGVQVFYADVLDENDHLVLSVKPQEIDGKWYLVDSVSGNRYTTDNVSGGSEANLVKLTFTSQARPEPQPTTGWDVVVSKGTSAYDVQASSVLRDFSDCFAFDSHNQSLFDAYLSDYSYNTTKGYVIYVDNTSGNTGTMSDNIINLIGADSQYGMLIVYKDNATTHSYFHLSIDGVKHTVSVDGRKTLSLEGFTPTLRPLDIYSGLSGQIILPD